MRFIGAFIGHWLLLRLGIHLGPGTLNLIVKATVGAVVLLLGWLPVAAISAAVARVANPSLQ
jgi:uncharacterized membrane protein YeaQ/YmgE (transglycosylase-associated protein family)